MYACGCYSNFITYFDYKIIPFLFRYLSQTFGLAFSYCKPDVVIFLGDLMDEGSKATPLEYKYYYYRIQSIFSAAKYTKVSICKEKVVFVKTKGSILNKN